jgi:flagellar basal body L-ring protein FlgH
MVDPNLPGKLFFSFIIVVILFYNFTAETQAEEALNTRLEFNDPDMLNTDKVGETPSKEFMKVRPANNLKYGWNREDKMLFSSLAALQLADVVTTKIAINRGAEELNPLFGSHPNFGFIIGAKLGVTAGTWYVMDQIVPKRDKKITLLILNAVMMAVVANNIAVAARF